MTKVASYVRFIAGGVKGNVWNGKAFRFLSDEITTKTRRLANERLRRRFDSASRADYTAFPVPAHLDQVQVFSLCHGGGTPEQKLSILSFLRHVGAPRQWSIVSDGSITSAQADGLQALHPSIKVVSWKDFICDANRACCEEFSKYTIFAKKFALESNLPVDGATLYIDTDIVFFGGSSRLRDLLYDIKDKTYYQRDLPGFMDESFMTIEELQAPPLNAGFVIQGRRIDWSVPIARLIAAMDKLTPEEKSYDLEKLEQAVTHVAHVMAGSQPLDDRYVLEISDRLLEDDTYAGPNIVMRHYVRPVRHKMWKHAAEYLR